MIRIPDPGSKTFNRDVQSNISLIRLHITEVSATISENMAPEAVLSARQRLDDECNRLLLLTKQIQQTV